MWLNIRVANSLSGLSGFGCGVVVAARCGGSQKADSLLGLPLLAVQGLQRMVW